MEVMEDPEFDQKFPELAKVKKSQEKAKKSDKVQEIPIEDDAEEDSMEPMEEKLDVKAKFTQGLLKCTNFSAETKALLSLVGGSGEGGRFVRQSVCKTASS